MDELTEGEIREAAMEAEALSSSKVPRSPIQVCTDAYRAWKQPKPHPTTGDMLQPGERITWKVMSIYRRWTVFFVLQLVTIIWWTHPHLLPGGLVGWNLLWSDLAVVVEMMVGIAFMNQSMRDARIIRDSLKNLEGIVASQKQLTLNHGNDMMMLRAIYGALHPDGEGVLSVKIDGVTHALEIHDHGTLPTPKDTDG